MPNPNFITYLRSRTCPRSPEDSNCKFRPNEKKHGQRNRTCYNPCSFVKFHSLSNVINFALWRQILYFQMPYISYPLPIVGAGGAALRTSNRVSLIVPLGLNQTLGSEPISVLQRQQLPSKQLKTLGGRRYPPSNLFIRPRRKAFCPSAFSIAFNFCCSGKTLSVLPSDLSPASGEEGFSGVRTSFSLEGR